MKKIRLSTVSQVYEAFLHSRKALGAKEVTLRTYRTSFLAVCKYADISELPMEELSHEVIDKMISKMVDAELSPNSINSYTSALRTFFLWAKEQGYTQLTIKPYKRQETVKTPYTDAELKKLLKKPSLKRATFPEYRTWVIINLLVNCGCRAATVRSFLVQDVDLESKTIFARHMKNGRPQPLPLCSQMVDILDEYLFLRDGKPNDYLFCTDENTQLTENGLRYAVKRYNLSRGVEKTSIHLFRHTFARKYLVDCGGNAFTLQKLLGHSALDMTKHYCAIYDVDLVKNFDEFSPLSQLSTKRIKLPTGKR